MTILIRLVEWTFQGLIKSNRVKEIFYWGFFFCLPVGLVAAAKLAPLLNKQPPAKNFYYDKTPKEMFIDNVREPMNG